MGEILVGTTSWTDKTLVGSGLFYPPEVKTPEARLRYYASRFPIVEVDSSYYALPALQSAVAWAERTPAGFVFDVKAFRIFTQHQTPPKALPFDIRSSLPPGDKNLYYRDLPREILLELWRRFRSALEPLRVTGKLGAVLLQFPPWFLYRRSSLDHILECAAMLGGWPLAVEFRNQSWFTDRHREDVFRIEQAHGLAHVVVDEPQGFDSSIPTVWALTSPELAVIRLHGRNRDNWLKKGISAAERFNYLYSETELRELVTPVRDLALRAKRVHVLFNNCHSDSAQRNAAHFTQLLTH